MPTILVARAVEALTGMTVEDFKAAASSITTVGGGETMVSISGEDTVGSDDEGDEGDEGTSEDAPEHVYDPDDLMSSGVLQ